MTRFILLFFVFLICSPLVVEKVFAEDIVTYRVSATSTLEWDLEVNGVPFVRHRPTGFGLSMYSGSINRIVSNGVNVVSFLKTDKIHATDPKSGNIKLEIDYIFDYQGQPSYGRTIPLLLHTGFSETNLFFIVDSSTKRLSSKSHQLSTSDRPDRWMLLGTIVLYVFFVNLYGFIMVANDRQYSKNQKVRIPSGRFVGNALLGGGIGILLGVTIKRHDMDKKFPLVVIPVVIIMQITLIVLACTPVGSRVLKRVTPRQPALHVPVTFDKATDFLKSLRKTDPVNL